MVPAAAHAGLPGDCGRRTAARAAFPIPATMGPDLHPDRHGRRLPARPGRHPQPADRLEPESDDLQLRERLRATPCSSGPAERADVLVDFSGLRRPDAHPLQRRAGGVPGPRPALRLLHGQPRPDGLRRHAPDPARFRPQYPHHHADPGRRATAATRSSSTARARVRLRQGPTRPSGASSRSRRIPSSIPQAYYNSAYDGTFPADPYVQDLRRVQDLPDPRRRRRSPSRSSPRPSRTKWARPIDIEYGRMSGFLGVQLPVGGGAQRFTLLPLRLASRRDPQGRP